VRGYSFEINYRVRPDSKREKQLLEVCREYNIQPGCRVFDRILEDRYLMIHERAARKAEALRKKEDAEKELRRLIAGE